MHQRSRHLHTGTCIRASSSKPSSNESQYNTTTDIATHSLQRARVRSIPASLAATLVAVACALYTTPLSLQQLLQRVRSIHSSLAATLVAARARALIRAHALYTRLSCCNTCCSSRARSCALYHASLAALYSRLSRCNTCISAPLIFPFFFGRGSGCAL